MSASLRSRPSCCIAAVRRLGLTADMPLRWLWSAVCQSRHPVVTPHGGNRVHRAGDWMALIYKEIEEKSFDQKAGHQSRMQFLKIAADRNGIRKARRPREVTQPVSANTDRIMP